MCGTVSGRGQSVNLLEFPREVTLIFDSDAIHNLLDRQSRVPQKLSGLLHSERPKVVCRRHADFGLEQMLESRGRQIYCARKCVRRPFTLEILLHEGKRGSHAWIHEAPTFFGKSTTECCTKKEEKFVYLLMRGSVRVGNTSRKLKSRGKADTSYTLALLARQGFS